MEEARPRTCGTCRGHVADTPGTREGGGARTSAAASLPGRSVRAASSEPRTSLEEA